MGTFTSQPKVTSTSTIPPGAYLKEIFDDRLDKDMCFHDGLILNIPVQLSSLILTHFPLEKKKYLQRFRKVDDETNQVIVSYTIDNEPSIQDKLNELGIEATISTVPLPLWAPLTEQQREQCLQFWPLNLILSPPTPIEEPLEPHRRLLTEIMKNHSIIITKPGCGEVLGSAISDCLNCQGNIKHGIFQAIRDASHKSSENSDYLCTGYDVYCYTEPCCMCAMALIHSRIGRLFFIQQNPDFGGIMSQTHIHSTPQLNHHYRAFRLQYKIE